MYKKRWEKNPTLGMFHKTKKYQHTSFTVPPTPAYLCPWEIKKKTKKWRKRKEENVFLSHTKNSAIFLLFSSCRYIKAVGLTSLPDKSNFLNGICFLQHSATWSMFHLLLLDL